MNVPRYASQAARLLSGRLGEASAPPGDRARGIATLEHALLARKRSRAVRWVLLAAAAFALFIGGIITAGRFTRTSVAASDGPAIDATVSPHGAGAVLMPGGAPLHAGERLRVGTELQVAQLGSASLELSTGTRFELESDSWMTPRTLTAHQRFYLAKGALEARVAKLGSGQRFVIETPDAEIEVRGTAFRLAVLRGADGCAAEGRTRLVVHEGVVEVRAAGRVARIGAGGHWPECRDINHEPAPPSPAEPPTEHVATVRAPASGAPHRAKQTEPAVTEATSSAALVEQNDLFAEGVAARKRGDGSAALAAYERLIEKYPGSALVENAMVERMRLLGKANPDAARREAERYLARYPSGFARTEAERILTGAP